MEKYTGRITSQHRDKPKFRAVVEAVVAPAIEAGDALRQVGEAFNLETAVGSQLDIIGLWVGVGRRLTVPLEDVFFSFDDPDLGFDQGTWRGPFDPDTQLFVLPDDTYRALIRTKIQCNHWDGSLEQMRVIWADLFRGVPLGSTFVQDNQDMTVTMNATGTIPAALVQTVLQGLVPLKPHGVRIIYQLTSYTGRAFAFDLDTPEFAGFDEGVFATFF